MNQKVPDARRLGQIIKEHRIERELTQAELAWRLQVDEKTLRDWEHGRGVVFMRPANKMKLHEELRIPPQILGLPDHFTSAGALELHKQIPSFLERGSYVSVYENSKLLIEGYRALRDEGFPIMPSILTHAYYTKGLATATLTNKSLLALRLYEQMERAAAEAHDSIGVAIARTYQGDAYRRIGKYDVAQRLLEEVIDQFSGVRFSGMDALVAGNCHQLLARVHLAKREKDETLDALKRAEELANAATPEQERDWYICFCRCSVKEELAKSLMLLNQYPKPFEAIEEAKRLAQEAGARWAIPISITEGEALVRYGRRTDNQSAIDRGMGSLADGYKLAERHHHSRQQQRILRLMNRWEDKAGLMLARVQEFRDKVAKVDGERSEA